MDKRDKFRGCLIGGAVGDALGYAVEFCSEREIFTKYGEDGISEFDLKNGKAIVSDDTQMTMFTATALLDAVTRGRMRGIMGKFEDYIALEYGGWYLTQTVSFPVDSEENYAKYSWIMNLPELFQRRAPGNTCLSALASGEIGTVEKPINDSKGCGGIMRVAPIGLYFANGNHTDMKRSEIDLIGAEAAAVTHGHELGYIPAAAFVHIINLLADNENISVLDAVADSVVVMRKIFKSSDQLTYFHKLMEKAAYLAETSDNDIDAIHKLGEGWVAEETLAIAVYCAIKYQNDFEKAVCTSVNHNGDSDSTGAVCGNILGAYLGLSNIPQKYKDDLEFYNVLTILADDLLDDCMMSEYGDFYDEAWSEKYIKKTYKP